MSRTSTPGAVPRGCYAVYRGNLGGDPKSIERDRPFASARMGVNMAAPDVGAEERDQLTEWVNIIAFSDALRAKLLKCSRGERRTVLARRRNTGRGQSRITSGNRRQYSATRRWAENTKRHRRRHRHTNASRSTEPGRQKREERCRRTRTAAWRSPTTRPCVSLRAWITEANARPCRQYDGRPGSAGRRPQPTHGMGGDAALRDRIRTQGRSCVGEPIHGESTEHALEGRRVVADPEGATRCTLLARVATVMLDRDERAFEVENVLAGGASAATTWWRSCAQPRAGSTPRTSHRSRPVGAACRRTSDARGRAGLDAIVRVAGGTLRSGLREHASPTWTSESQPAGSAHRYW